MNLDRLLRIIALRWRSLIHRAEVERELSEELEYHIERQTAEYMARGMDPAAARTAALRAFGGVEYRKERSRDVRGLRWLEDLVRDLRFGLRTLRRSPVFTAVVVATLALGVGATTAVFSLVDGILLEPLPFPQSDRLVQVQQSWPEIGLDTWSLSQTNTAVYLERQKSFSAFTSYALRNATLGGDRPSQLNLLYAAGDFFGVFDVQPRIGRAFTRAEDAPGRNHVVILSHRFWRTRFGADPAVIGRTIPINGFPTKVIGVMPAGFSITVTPADALMPLGLDRNQPWGWFLTGVGRLKPDVTPAVAQRSLTGILWAATRENPLFVGRNAVPASSQHISVVVTPLRKAMIGGTARPLLLLQVAVLFLLLIGGANVAMVLMSRGATRARELALRTALGAGRGRVVRQLLTETTLLAMGGAAAGLALAFGGVKLLPHLPITSLPRAQSVGIDGRVLAFALVLSAAVGLLFGVMPAFHAHRMGLGQDLTGSSRGGLRGSTRRTQAGLVVTQVALSLMLLVGAGLVLESVHRVLTLDMGFRPDGVTVVSLPLPQDRYGSGVPDGGARITEFTNQLLDHVRALPGVRAAAVAWGPPFWGTGSNGYSVEGHELAAGAAGQAIIDAVSPGYFSTMEIPLERGRDFTDADRADAPPVAVVDQALARRFWPDGNAVGHRILMTGEKKWRTIVGVVGAIRDNTPADAPAPHAYFPHAQAPGRFVNLEVRAAGAASVIPSVLSAAKAIEPDVPLDVVVPLSDVVRSSIADRRLTELLLGGFALIALLLATVGIYGVMTLFVVTRRREFGVRLAVGARPSGLVVLVLGRGARLVGAGVLLGLLGAGVATRWIGSLLYETSATDPLILSAISLLLLAVAMGACYLPSRRAATSDPLTALRTD